jgi:hypothetical protein
VIAALIGIDLPLSKCRLPLLNRQHYRVALLPADPDQDRRALANRRPASQPELHHVDPTRPGAANAFSVVHGRAT